MTKANIYGKDFEKEVERMLGTLSEANRKPLIGYVEHNRQRGVTFQRLYKIVINIRTFINRGQVRDIRRTDAGAVKEFFNSTESQGCSIETLRDYKIVLSGFYRWLHGIKGQTLPPEMEFLEGRQFKHVKKSGPVLTEEDIRRMIDVSLTLRDKCFITLLWESGGRIGEILGMQRKDVLAENKDKREFRLYLDGKTGPREILVVDKWGYADQYLNGFVGDSKTSLFCTRHRAHATYPAFRKMLTETAKRAGIDKKINPHWFRHSRATCFAEAGMSPMHMVPYMGWSNGTKMIGTYTHHSARSADNTIRLLHSDNSEEFMRKNFGELDSCESRANRVAEEELLDRFFQKYGGRIIQRFVESYQELETYSNAPLTNKKDAPAGIFKPLGFHRFFFGVDPDLSFSQKEREGF